MLYQLFFFFFFSSRRRHTRFDCDWSSACALPIFSQVSLLGARNYQIDIEIPEVTLRKHGLTLQKVADLVRRENIELPGGVIKRSEERRVGKERRYWWSRCH